MENLPLTAIVVIWLFAIPLTIIHLREHRLPNAFTYSAIAASLVSVVIAGFVDQDFVRTMFSLGLGMATAVIGYFMALANGIGMGDVKLLTAMNIALGWFVPFLILLMLAIAFTLAAMVSLGMIIAKKANLKTPLAMGPFLLVGFGLVSVNIFEGLFTGAV